MMDPRDELFIAARTYATLFHQMQFEDEGLVEHEVAWILDVIDYADRLAAMITSRMTYSEVVFNGMCAVVEVTELNGGAFLRINSNMVFVLPSGKMHRPAQTFTKQWELGPFAEGAVLKAAYDWWNAKQAKKRQGLITPK